MNVQSSDTNRYDIVSNNNMINQEMRNMNNQVQNQYQIPNQNQNQNQNNNQNQIPYINQNQNQNINVNVVVYESVSIDNLNLGKMDKLYYGYLHIYEAFLQNSMLCLDPMATLASCPSICIKQKINVMEIVYCDIVTRYDVYFVNRSNNQKIFLFDGMENSSYCSRYCKSPHREFQLALKHKKNFNFLEIDDTGLQNAFVVYDRPYKCECCCYCSRPGLTGYYNSLGGPEIGQIQYDFTYMDPIFHVKNKLGQIIYSITSDCCKCGYLCNKNICCEFEQVVFFIFKGESVETNQSHEAIGKIIKYSGGVQSFLTQADNFEVIFPIDASPEDKLNLIGAAFMIDYLFFFEEYMQIRLKRPKHHKRHHHHGIF